MNDKPSVQLRAPCASVVQGFTQNVKKLIRQVFELIHIGYRNFPFFDLY
jgi:hypothetical protein